MNDKAGTQDLDDEDIVDTEPVEASDTQSEASSDDEDPPPVHLIQKRVKVKADTSGPIARRSAARNAPKGGAHEFLKTISSALDPSHQLARNNERNTQTLQVTQILTLSNQVRDLQSTIEAYRDRLMESERKCHEAERRADRAEFMSLIDEGRRDRQREQAGRPRRRSVGAYYRASSDELEVIPAAPSPTMTAVSIPASTTD